MARYRRVAWGLTAVSGLIAALFVALFAAFRAPAVGVIVAGVLLLPVIAFAWLEDWSRHRRVAAYRRERERTHRRGPGDSGEKTGDRDKLRSSDSISSFPACPLCLPLRPLVPCGQSFSSTASPVPTLPAASVARTIEDVRARLQVGQGDGDRLAGGVEQAVVGEDRDPVAAVEGVGGLDQPGQVVLERDRRARSPAA